MSDDTPTERFQSPTSSGGPEGAKPTNSANLNGKKTSRTLILILSIIGGLLLIAVVVMLTLLFSRGTGAPMATPSGSPDTSASPSETPSETPSASPSASPSESPSASPSAAPPPPSTGPVFNTFSPTSNSSVGCASNSGQMSVTFTWTSSGANEAAIGVATTDAFAGSYETGLPPSGSYELNYECNVASQIYTVSIRGTSGQTNKSITLKR